MLLTVGHGTASQSDLAGVLLAAGVEALVDVRRFPASRAHPHVRREALEQWLPPAGVAYRWEPRLGGRRRLPADTVAADTWWTVEAFRAYAAHTRTAQFATALDALLEQATRRRTAVMCSETVWWRCHRRLIADVVVLGRGGEVTHLLPPGPPRPHVPAAGARVADDGCVVWDATPAAVAGAATPRPDRPA